MSQMNLEDLEPGLLDDLKNRVVEVGRGLFENKLVVSTFGVVSTRISNTDYVLITPSVFSKACLDKDNLIIVDLDVNLVQGKFRASVETPMHACIHKKRPDLSTVIHTHSPMACAFAAANMEIQ